MTEPIIGVDPYLESQGYDRDFHARFVTHWSDAIADLLPDQYEARINERWDVYQTAWERSPTEQPPISPLIEEETREAYIEIRHRPDRSLVAVLELLSAANKEEPDRSIYLANRNGLLLQHVHLFELDLLLRGQRLPLAEDLPPGDFYAFLSHAERRPNCDVYTWRLNQPLPTLPIPLRAPDADIYVDLAAVFATTYQRGRYSRSIDYARPLGNSQNK